MITIKNTIAALALGVSLAPLGGCQTSTAGGAVGANRPQLMLVSSRQLDQMADESYATLRSEAAHKGTLNRDADKLARVRRIAGRLEAQTPIFRPDAPAWKWEVNVVTSDERNAFCLPGGKIMVYSGLIDQLHLTDDEIAVVLGHEIGHALREHSREQVSQAMAAQTAIGIAALFGFSEGSASVANVGYEALVATRFSRTDENEADRIGLELAARAGYDPRAGTSLWKKMVAAGQAGRAPEFLSSHPAEASRAQQSEALLPTVMPLYEAARWRG